MSFLRKWGPLLIGALAGAFIGGTGFSWGYFSIGSTIAGYLLNRPPKAELTGAQVQKSAYGQAIPILYGTFPSIASNIIDAPEDGALEEVPWKEGSFKRSLTAAFLFCLGEAGDGLGERRIDELTFNDIVFFKRDGATDKERHYLWREDAFNPFSMTPGTTFTYDPATGMEHFSGYHDEKGFWGQSNEWIITRGTRTQTPIDFLADLHGGAVPAYHDCVLLATNRLLLKPWQESIPTVKAKIYNVTTGLTEICTAHLVRGGVDSDLLDLSAMETALVTTVEGCIQQGSEAPRQLVDALAAWAFCDICETDGQIIASDRANPDFFTISTEELAAFDANGGGNGGGNNAGMPPALKLSVNAALDTPNLLRVRFYDSGVDGNVNEVTANRQIGTTQNEQTLDMPLVASQEAAQKFTQMALDEFHASKTPLEIALPPNRLKIGPGDVVDVTDAQGNASSFRVQEQALGAPGLILCQCSSWNGEVYDQPHAPAGITRPAPAVPSYSVPDYALIDTVALDDESVAASGLVLIFAASAPANQSWSEVELSFGEAANIVASLTGKRAILGETSADLAIGSRFVFDDAASVRVTLTDTRQTLESVTVSEARAGANEALINGHLIRFTTADYVSPGVYDLSGILFGLRGTETCAMPAGSKFLLLRDSDGNSTPGWTKVYLNGANYTRAYGAQPVTFGLHYSPLDLYSDFTQTLAYNSRKAIAPAYEAVRSDGAGGAIFSFRARTRGDGADLFWMTGEIPDLTDPLTFDIVLFDEGTTTVLNTRRVTSSLLVAGSTTHLEVPYSAAQLTTIFGGAPTALEGVIYPVNAAGRGLGRPFVFDMP